MMKQETKSTNEKIFINLCSVPIFRTELNKLYFFIDALYFYKHKKNPSNMTYLKLPYGPVPTEISTVKSKLKKEKKIVEYERCNFYNSMSYLCEITDKKYLEEYKIDDKNLKKVFDIVINTLKGYSVGYLSRLSHIIEPWKSALYGDVLDFDKLGNMEELIEKEGYKELMKGF